MWPIVFAEVLNQHLAFGNDLIRAMIAVNKRTILYIVHSHGIPVADMVQPHIWLLIVYWILANKIKT